MKLDTFLEGLLGKKGIVSFIVELNNVMRERARSMVSVSAG